MMFFNNDMKQIKKSGLFDAQYYLKTYTDVKNMGVNPLKHFCEHGWKEGKNPSANFNTKLYLEMHQDVKDLGVNPLISYILYKREVGKIRDNHISKVIQLTKCVKNNPHLIKKFFIELKKYGLLHSLKRIKSKIDTDSAIDRATIDLVQHTFDIPRIAFNDTSEEYKDYQEHEPINFLVKAIAFYLPQFHPFPENDKWWGKGFTEWTNVTKAKPNFVGHYQPHLPIHNGFYDLRIPEVMIEQAKLARNYGIYGFNFYYYWFDGKVLMHRPFEILLEHKEIDINFCITWANENWTRRWDGQANDILIAQNHCHEDSLKFIESLYQYFEDERYIRIQNKPVLIIYRSDIIPDMKKTLTLWREAVCKQGFDGLYLICAQTFGIKSPRDNGFDAAMEFPPHVGHSKSINNNQFTLVNQNFNGVIYDYAEFVDNAIKVPTPDYKVFKTTMFSWDNTARKQNNSHIFFNFSLIKYKQWFANTVFSTLNNEKYCQDEKIVFINAWNEWAEGTHLEPDRKYGYGYLQATYDILKNLDNKYRLFLYPFPQKRAHDIAIILHMQDANRWEDISASLVHLKKLGFDLYITLANSGSDIVEKIIEKYPSANIRFVEDRGQDILPFIELYKNIQILEYKYICKIHSQRVGHKNDSLLLGSDLYSSLLGSEQIIEHIIKQFDENSDLGLMTDNQYLVQHMDYDLAYNRDIVNHLSKLLKLKFEYSIFPLASMFWFRPKALQGINVINDSYFETEQGYIAGTTAHGIERLWCLLVQKNGFKYSAI